jgi:hypothetical protein
VADDLDAQQWQGPWRRYDIVKEGVIAIAVVSLLTIGLSAVFGSPDEPALTFKGWATSAPDNFYATTVAQLAGTSESAGYGPPYNTNGEGVAVGPLNLQKLMGVRIPVDAANDFVITPLESQQQPSAVTAAVGAWKAASPDRRTAWATAYDDAIAATANDAGEIDLAKVEAGEFGPVPVLAEGLTNMAASGAYDGILLANGGFYQTDHTRQILFLGDGSYLADAATTANLQGNTWGMMNETGSWPGQTWLWAYSLWYQLPMFNAADDATGFSATLTGGADAIIFYLMALLSLLLIMVPFIPGLRSIPRWIPIHRLVWRDYYRRQHGAVR